MTILRRLFQCMDDACAQPQWIVRLDVHLRGDSIRRQKTNSINIFRKAIRIPSHDFRRRTDAIRPNDAIAESRRQPKTLQKHARAALFALRMPCVPYLRNAFCPNAGHFLQTFRIVVENIQRIQPELIDNSIRIDFADAW